MAGKYALIRSVTHRNSNHTPMIYYTLTGRHTALPALSARQALDTADRVINRFWDYPKLMRPLRGRYDLFHIVEHSYAHLALVLPAGRAVVTCHDLDAIRCLVEPRGRARKPR